MRDKNEAFYEQGKGPSPIILVPVSELEAFENRLARGEDGPGGGDNVFAVAEGAKSKGVEQLDRLSAQDKVRISAASLGRVMIEVEGVPHMLLMLHEGSFKKKAEQRYIPIGGGVQYVVDQKVSDRWQDMSPEEKLEAIRNAPARKTLIDHGAFNETFEGDKARPNPVTDMRFQTLYGDNGLTTPKLKFVTDLNGVAWLRDIFENWQDHTDLIEHVEAAFVRELIEELGPKESGVFPSEEPLENEPAQSESRAIRKIKGEIASPYTFSEEWIRRKRFLKIFLKAC